MRSHTCRRGGGARCVCVCVWMYRGAHPTTHLGVHRPEAGREGVTLPLLLRPGARVEQRLDAHDSPPVRHQRRGGGLGHVARDQRHQVAACVFFGGGGRMHDCSPGGSTATASAPPHRAPLRARQAPQALPQHAQAQRILLARQQADKRLLARPRRAAPPPRAPPPPPPPPFLMIRRPPRSTPYYHRRQRQMCLRYSRRSMC